MSAIAAAPSTSSSATASRRARIGRKVAATSAIAAGAIWIVHGVLNLTDGKELRALEGSSTLWHTGLGMFAVALALGAIALAYMARFAASPIAGRVSAVGHVAIALLSTSSNLHGADYPWFPAVGIPGNLLIFGGMIGLAVGLYRAKRMPRYTAVLPLIYVLSFPMGPLGLGIAAGALWLALGYAIATTPERARAN